MIGSHSRREDRAMSETPDEEGIPETSIFDKPAQDEPEEDKPEPAKSAEPLPQPIRGGYFDRLSARLREALHLSSRR
jgi:hypothetical protein